MIDHIPDATKMVSAQRCPHCGAPAQSETPSRVEYVCGSGFEIAGSEMQTWECDRVKPEKPICAHCGDPAATIAATFADFECGTTWTEIEGWHRSEKCRGKGKE